MALFLIYAIALVLTAYNIYEVKNRVHTKVLLRTQVMLILIESLRLLSAILCIM